MVSHAGKWPCRAAGADRCLRPDAPFPGQTPLIKAQAVAGTAIVLQFTLRTRPPASRPSGKLLRAV